MFLRGDKMGLTVNTIITLENNEKYIVLNETFYQGSKYFMVMGVDEEKQIIPNNVAIFKELIEGLDTYIVKVEDSDLKNELAKELKEQI